MTNLEIAKENFAKVKQGSLSVNNFYGFLWSKAVLLKQDEWKEIVALSEELSKENELIRAHHLFSLGFQCIYAANFAGAIEVLEQAIALYEALRDDGGGMIANTLMCVCYRSIGQLDKAQVYIQTALKKAASEGAGEPYSYFYSVTYYQAGELSTELKNYDDAIAYYNTSLLHIHLNHELKGRILCGLGTVYMHLEDWERSIASLNAALEAVSSQNNYLLLSKVYYDISNYHYKRREFDEALANQHKSLDLRLEHKLLNPATTSYVLIAEIYYSKGEYKEAIRYGELGAGQAAKLNTLIKLFEAHEILSKAYEAVGDIAKAFDHYKKFQKYRAEVHNQEAIKKIEQLKTQYKMESMENEKEIFRLRNVELKAAFEEIEMKQNEILDSIRYAHRIQRALLPPERFIEKTIERLRGSR